jgi:primosomal protein N' (replication factor Y)
MMRRFAEVALHLPRVQGTFTYHIPDELLPNLTPGHLVVVPFGRRRAQGIVLRLTEQSPVPETRPIEALVEAQPVLTPAQLGLVAWMHQATLAPIGACAATMIPAGLSQHADQEYRLLDAAFPPDGGRQGQLVKLLRARGPLRGRQIERRLGRRDRASHHGGDPGGDWRRAADSLVRRGILESTPVLEEPRVAPRHIRTVRLAVPPAQAQESLGDLGRGKAAERRRSALQTVLEESKPLDVTWVYAEAGARAEDLRHLERRGLIAFDAREALRDPLAEASVGQAALRF